MIVGPLLWAARYARTHVGKTESKWAEHSPPPLPLTGQGPSATDKAMPRTVFSESPHILEMSDVKRELPVPLSEKASRESSASCKQTFVFLRALSCLSTQPKASWHTRSQPLG